MQLLPVITVSIVLLWCVDCVIGQYERCSKTSCFAPGCVCPSRRGPIELSVQETPQIVLFSFDDAVNEQNFKFYKKLFTRKRTNPNGCPIQSTFFVSHDWTNYNYVKELYLDGHEIGSHSITHRLPRNWWSQASYDDWVEEMDGQRENINKKAKIPKSVIRGIRVPFLEIGGNTQFSAMQEYGFVYDASFLAGPYSEGDWRTAVWPYTLQHAPNREYCDNTNCPSGNFTGVWEVPLNRWIGLDGRACPMVDACSSQNLLTKEMTLKYLWKNFNRFHANGRAPFGINMHATWFQKEFKFDAMEEFLEALLKRDDVYVITFYQMVEWMRKATPLSELADFAPWKTGCKKGRLLVGRPKSSRKKSSSEEKSSEENSESRSVSGGSRSVSGGSSSVSSGSRSSREKKMRRKKKEHKSREMKEESNEMSEEIKEEEQDFIKKIKKAMKKKTNQKSELNTSEEDNELDADMDKNGSYKRREKSAVEVMDKENQKPKVKGTPAENDSSVKSKKAAPTQRSEETQVQRGQAELPPQRNNRLFRHGYRSGATTAVAMAHIVPITVAMAISLNIWFTRL